MRGAIQSCLSHGVSADVIQMRKESKKAGLATATRSRNSVHQKNTSTRMSKKEKVRGWLVFHGLINDVSFSALVAEAS